MADNSKSNSLTFPYATLKTCLAIGESIKRIGGSKGGVSRDAIAADLKVGANSPGLIQTITSAKHFGIAEGNKYYSLTENAKRFFFPKSDEDKRLALLDIFASPSLFAHLLGHYNGEQLPSTEHLANYLVREGKVVDSWSRRAAAIFVGSARDLNLVDDQNFLRYAAARQNVVVQPEAAELQTEPAAPTVFVSEKQPIESNVEDVWVFSFKGKTVRLETPTDMPMKLWQKLNLYVQILKPTEEEGETSN